MTPDTLRLMVDIAALLIGVYAIVMVRKSALGGLFGEALTYILTGMFILTMNHALDTVFLAASLKAAGHTNDLLQPPNVHRYINLVGFIFIAIGAGVASQGGSKKSDV